MKQILYVLPLALSPVMAQAVDAQAIFQQALDELRTTQSEELGMVVTAVLEATGGDEQAFVRMMRSAADAGHPVALTWLARQALLQLQAHRVNPETATEAEKLRAAMEQAASTGYIPAVVEMAHLCSSGVGAPADEKQGMAYLMQACKANSARARAAYLFLSGRLEKEGASSAAVQAELKRRNYFVEEFLSVFTAREDETKSQEWLMQAATHGSPGAAGTLALYYLQEGKVALGYDFLKQAAERNHPESLAQLAAFTLPGAELPDGLRPLITQDTATAIRLFQRAALLGCTAAFLPLAGEYQKQPDVYSAERIFELYRQAADAGDPRGGVAYAYCLASGRGCTPDAERGVRVLKQLVDAGVAFANIALADLYFNGTGVQADMPEALRCLSAAASAGVPKAYTLMAVLAQLGNASRASEPSRARLYLRIAEERGEQGSQAAFDEMVKLGGWKFIP